MTRRQLSLCSVIRRLPRRSDHRPHFVGFPSHRGCIARLLKGIFPKRRGVFSRGKPLYGGYVLEVDIRKFFDNLDHGHLRQFLRLRVRDGVLLRLIGKWLKAGVMKDGSVSYPDSGSLQGVVSPLLSNVFLYYVLDLWFEHDVKPCMCDRAFLTRFADDVVTGSRRSRCPARHGSYSETFW